MYFDVLQRPFRFTSHGFGSFNNPVIQQLAGVFILLEEFLQTAFSVIYLGNHIFPFILGNPEFSQAPDVAIPVVLGEKTENKRIFSFLFGQHFSGFPKRRHIQNTTVFVHKSDVGNIKSIGAGIFRGKGKIPDPVLLIFHPRRFRRHNPDTGKKVPAGAVKLPLNHNVRRQLFLAKKRRYITALDLDTRYHRLEKKLDQYTFTAPVGQV
ncbi:MAG TPA: hypothetical protein DCK76_08550 [Desulfotomaculum sp.]|nr:hypothetical protein [Desulfotomaculum sp.]HBY05164.1 hypothetical protein [Desulfotomaculum sp.]